jgi:hypothetical protein
VVSEVKAADLLEAANLLEAAQQVRGLMVKVCESTLIVSKRKKEL